MKLQKIRDQFRFLLKRLLTYTPYFLASRKNHLFIPRPTLTLSPLDLVLICYGSQGGMPTVVQVGACDGVENDPLRFLLLKGRARAILVEPNPFAFTRLQKTYAGVPNVTLIQAAIGEHDGEVDFYRAKTPDLRGPEDEALQYASFYREHLLKCNVEPHQIERITVSARSLSSLIAELGLEQIDLLQIDAEGFDGAVVRMALKLPVKPSCINFEHLHLTLHERAPLFDLLKDNDYLLGCGEWDVLALQRSVLAEWKTRSK
jgi:FkbM family methyltransferase